MFSRHTLLAIATALLFWTSSPVAQIVPGSAFTYQGRLMEGSGPANGAYDLQFVLHNAGVGGERVGPMVTKDDVVVTAGIFTVTLDFGAVFSGSTRWLEIGVRPDGGNGAFTMLSPRQELTPALDALFSQAAPWTGVSGKPAGFADNIDNDVLGGLACAGNQGPKWNGAVWICAADADADSGVNAIANGGGITGNLAGRTLTLGSDATIQRRSASPTCAPGQSLRAIAPDGTPTCATDITNATNATQLGGQGGGFYLDLVTHVGTLSLRQGGTGATTAAAALATLGGQARVIGTCAPGTSLQSINSDGSVLCQTGGPRAGATLTTFDSVFAFDTSITIGADGLGLISYQDFGNGHLTVAHCANVLCSSLTEGSPATLDSVGVSTSITIGVDGLGLISYYDSTNGDLKVAHCANVVCSSLTAGSPATLDSVGSVGLYTSITIGVDGLGLISYYDSTNGDLKVAHCANVVCSSVTEGSPATLDGVGSVGLFTSITIGADGVGLISYGGADLKVAHCANVACTSGTSVRLDNAGGYDTSITIGADGLGLISYFASSNGDLKVAHCANVACSSATPVTLAAAAFPGGSSAITIGADGLGLISYWDFGNADLKVAHCANVACSSATTVALDSPAFVGQYTSITIGADGLPLISYRDDTTSRLKVAHCSNASCSPFVVRRR